MFVIDLFLLAVHTKGFTLFLFQFRFTSGYIRYIIALPNAQQQHRTPEHDQNLLADSGSHLPLFIVACTHIIKWLVTNFHLECAERRFSIAFQSFSRLQSWQTKENTDTHKATQPQRPDTLVRSKERCRMNCYRFHHQKLFKSEESLKMKKVVFSSSTFKWRTSASNGRYLKD